MQDKIWSRILRNVKTGAKKTKINLDGGYTRGRRECILVDISIKDLINQFEKQNGFCYWFNKPMDLNNNLIPHHPLALSVDRIDNSLGYTKDNFVLCFRFANVGRGKWPSKEFGAIVSALKE